ncbi:hypothetical protein DHW03_17055 [Pedobacter yonginense]|uniref:ADP-ribosylglycohydrolase family protein n=1 Tax=Pedobacter yonginense TaxID=651869 RepID=A0A317EK35_9SPHI|nr:ADP-ribosylglycohydrolase family protein [Pedobacter yonginense]PWS26487.1 hypothetical protein DHW03_17055 [Pedobacter yonginense]
MKLIHILISIISFSISLKVNAQEFYSLKHTELQNKIKGGWAGQMIGVSFGNLFEFRYQGSLINDYQNLPWEDGYLVPSLNQDDLYLDISFIETIEKEGINAPISSFSNAMAHAGYYLWHANQAARYNILNGISAPQSGYWVNNPHADCIDYQIESDFAGLISPGMPNIASEISDKVGHIMNYGDGWYGGVYFGAMYSLAFVSKDVEYVVNEALKSIPENTTYHQCISDVIKWHRKYPNDWKQTWFEIQKKWTDDIGCPGGVYTPFNIDAKVNSAYVVLGLLYGNGNFERTMEITTRCGQDADCNPSSACGILGAVLGYDAMPSKYKKGFPAVESENFKYTHTSLNKVYQLSYNIALENIKNYGGIITNNSIKIPKKQIKTVRWEQSFEGIKPFEKRGIGHKLEDEYTFDFTGNAFVINGEHLLKAGNHTDSEKLADIAIIELYIDGKFTETIKLPVNYIVRKHEIAWKYQLENKQHQIKLKLLNPSQTSYVQLNDVIFYEKTKNE